MLARASVTPQSFAVQFYNPFSQTQTPSPVVQHPAVVWAVTILSHFNPSQTGRCTHEVVPGSRACCGYDLRTVTITTAFLGIVWSIDIFDVGTSHHEGGSYSLQSAGLPQSAWVLVTNLHVCCSYDAYPQRHEHDPTARGNGPMTPPSTLIAA